MRTAGLLLLAFADAPRIAYQIAFADAPRVELRPALVVHLASAVRGLPPGQLGTQAVRAIAQVGGLRVGWGGNEG